MIPTTDISLNTQVYRSRRRCSPEGSSIYSLGVKHRIPSTTGNRSILIIHSPPLGRRTDGMSAKCDTSGNVELFLDDPTPLLSSERHPPSTTGQNTVHPCLGASPSSLPNRSRRNVAHFPAGGGSRQGFSLPIQRSCHDSGDNLGEERRS